jgi:hypothetical protein
MSMIPSQPTTPHQQAAIALAAITQQAAIGQRAIADACGKEFSPPKDLVGAAQIIKRLRGERDTAKADIVQAKHQIATQAATEAITVRGIADKRIAALNEQLAASQKSFDEFRRNVRDSLVDRQLSELPSLAGYFVGATPMQRAAEAGAVLIGIRDKIARPEFVSLMMTNYLRSRGWKLGVNNSWISAVGLSLPADNAVVKQVQIDTAPFMVFAKGMMGKSSADAMEDGQQFVAAEPDEAGREFIAKAKEALSKHFPASNVKADDAKTAYAPLPIAPHGDDELNRMPMTEPITTPIASTEAVGSDAPVYVGPDGVAASNIREDPSGSGRIVADFNGTMRVIAESLQNQDDDNGVAEMTAMVEASTAPQTEYMPAVEPLIAGQLKNKAHIPKPKPEATVPTSTPRYSGQVVSKPPRNTAETFNITQRLQ